MANPNRYDVVAEMVASVLTVEVEPDAVVSAGDTVVLLESMKMEIPVLCERGGRVAAVTVSPGDLVQEGDLLVVIES